MIEAAKARETARLGAIRFARSELKNRTIELGRDLKEEDVMDVLSHDREAPPRIDRAVRSAPAVAISSRKSVRSWRSCAGYLPEKLGESELLAIVDEAIADTGASSMSDLGSVMKAVMPRIKGRADGGAVRALVQTKLGTGETELEPGAQDLAATEERMKLRKLYEAAIAPASRSIRGVRSGSEVAGEGEEGVREALGQGEGAVRQGDADESVLRLPDPLRRRRPRGQEHHARHRHRDGRDRPGGQAAREGSRDRRRLGSPPEGAAQANLSGVMAMQADILQDSRRAHQHRRGHARVPASSRSSEVSCRSTTCGPSTRPSFSTSR